MKGQGALEYLMTYGWALLVVVVVGAALYSLGVLNPASYAKQACTGFVYFNAREFRMTEDGNFTIIVDNGPNRISFANITGRLPGTAWETPDAGNITGATCTDFSTCDNDADRNIGPNERHALSFQAPALAGNGGSPYTVEVKITYYTADMQHQDIATCNGKYETV